jgi:hypothetical protein
VQYSAKYRKDNLEAVTDRLKDWRLRNRNKVVDYRKVYVKANKDRINAWQRKHRQENPTIQIADNIRSRVKKLLKGTGRKKAGSGIRDMGCSLAFVKEYLESLFWPGMTWKNHGNNGWHIDHIVPLSSFDLSNREQFLVGCHYTNLQSLWEDDNMVKSRRLDWSPSESVHELPDRLRNYDKTYWFTILKQ